MKQLKRSTKIAISLILLGAFIVLGGWATGGWNELRDIATHYRQLTSVDLEEFDTLTIYAPVSVRVSDVKQPRLTYFKDKKHNLHPISYRNVESGLIIEESHTQSIINYDGLLASTFGLAAQMDPSYEMLQLELPKGMTLSEANIHVPLGDIELSDLTLKKLDVTTEAGHIRLTNVTVTTPYPTITSQLGDIHLDTTTFTDARIRLEAGDLTSKNITLLGENIIENQLGNVTLSLAPKHKDLLGILVGESLGDTLESDDSYEAKPHHLDVYIAAGNWKVE